ncbi:hypothetical protein HK105_202263 [Polyrhizophydium stewartii]|uniref:Uncharacterized protein n=1 Tax=Polyrhizophydium stewartii TaxID=2732419 RepID=A0ABR4NFN4_9FUNG
MAVGGDDPQTVAGNVGWSSAAHPAGSVPGDIGVDSTIQPPANEQAAPSAQMPSADDAVDAAKDIERLLSGGLPASRDHAGVAMRARAARHAYDLIRRLPSRVRQGLASQPNSAADIDPWHRLANASAAFERKLYPFAQQPSWAAVDMLAGRGIVMSAGNKDAAYAIIALQTIRRLGSKTPVELFYCGTQDLSEHNQKLVAAIPGVRVRNLADVFNLNTLGAHSYAIKLFAIAASSFEHVMFLDADAFFFKNPDPLFASPLFTGSGALFFLDRTLPEFFHLGPGMRSMLVDLSPPPGVSKKAAAGRVARQISVHEQEAGVLLWDKRRTMHAMLLATLFNSAPYRVHVWDKMHGEKETFWLAHEALALPYTWFPHAGTAVGYEDKERGVCGSLLHVDVDGTPLWFNGGLQHNKGEDEGSRQMLEFTHYVTDSLSGTPALSVADAGTLGREAAELPSLGPLLINATRPGLHAPGAVPPGEMLGTWVFGYHEQPWCLKPRSADWGEIRPLRAADKALATWMKWLWASTLPSMSPRPQR